MQFLTFHINSVFCTSLQLTFLKALFNICIFFSFFQRGIITAPKNEYYIINPLPSRLRRRSTSTPHVIVKWVPLYLKARDDKVLSCTLRHRNYVNKEVRDENSDSLMSEINHILSNSHISSFDNSRTFNSGKHDISRSAAPTLVPDLNRIAGVNLKKTEKLTLKQHVNAGSERRALIFNGDFHTTHLSPERDRAKFGDNRDSGIPDVSHCHDCLEDKDGGVPGRGKRSVVLLPGTPIHVETAVFIDEDLYQHMALNFPADTERELVRVVLAMINAVSLQSSHNCNYFSFLSLVSLLGQAYRTFMF